MPSLKNNIKYVILGYTEVFDKKNNEWICANQWLPSAYHKLPKGVHPCCLSVFVVGSKRTLKDTLKQLPKKVRNTTVPADCSFRVKLALDSVKTAVFKGEIDSKLLTKIEIGNILKQKNKQYKLFDPKYLNIKNSNNFLEHFRSVYLHNIAKNLPPKYINNILSLNKRVILTVVKLTDKEIKKHL